MSGSGPPTGSHADLVEERDYLLRSIDDLEREHEAGGIDDTDYRTLRAGYVERAAAAIRALEDVSPVTGAGTPAQPVPAGPVRAAPESSGASARPGPRSMLGRVRWRLGRRSTRRILVPLGIACVLGLVAVVAARAAGIRLPGEYASGSVTLSSAAHVRQELDQAAILATEGRLRTAISVYDTVLASVPHQAEALAYKGWLVRLAGIAARSTLAVADGDATLAEAARVAPGYAEARAFYAIALLEDEGDVRGAVTQLEAMLADRPTATLRRSVATSITSHFALLGSSVPAALRPFAVQPGAPRSS
ncbi:MAG: tetratricopeptide repeat protein [Acidimicrobiales bacterium]